MQSGTRLPDVATVQDENTLAELPGTLKQSAITSVAREKKCRTLQSVERQLSNQHRTMLQPLVINGDINLGSDGYQLNDIQDLRF